MELFSCTFTGFEITHETGQISGSYLVAGISFTEVWSVGEGVDLHHPATQAAMQWVYLFAGVSYAKSHAATVLDTGEIALTDKEAAFLATFYREGLGEFAYRNNLPLLPISVRGPRVAKREPVPLPTLDHGMLIPFGGGIDSIVTVEAVKREGQSARLFICGRPGDAFPAIEAPAAVTGLDTVRATRQLDPLIFDTAANGWLNGHVPITGVLSALAVAAALAHGHCGVLMSNEHSASVPNVALENGESINHQWSKSEHFEVAFQEILAETFGKGFSFGSFLRDRSELWVGEQFAQAVAYHSSFRSCNKAFRQDPAGRLTKWCGTCDKCCFIDLMLAPFLPKAALSAIFDGNEPLENNELAPQFATLVGLSPTTKPFECVGDPTECAAAATLAARRSDRATNTMLLEMSSQCGLSDLVIASLFLPLPSVWSKN